MTKVQSISVSVMLKTGMEVIEDCTIFNYGPPISQKEVNAKDRTIVAGSGVKSAPIFVLPGNNAGKAGQ